MRGWLLAPPLVFATLSTRWEVEDPWWTFGLGGVLFATGLTLRVWAQTHLRYRLRYHAGERLHKVLTETGPYRYVRNPIYLANGCMVLGATAASELLWLLPVVMLWCAVVLRQVVRYEEIELFRKYGAPYRAYCERVPRFWPRLRGTSPGERRAEPLRFLAGSLRAEFHNLLLLVPFVVKELLA